MEEEIKEILDKLNKIVPYASVPKELAYMTTNITPQDCKLLLDYITNLQEKVDQYENPDDLTLFYMWLDEKAKDKMKQLQEENEKLKEQIKKDNHILGCNFAQKNKYKSRNEKAIEYNKQIIKALLTCTSYEKDKVEDMLYEQQNILQGEDKDE